MKPILALLAAPGVPEALLGCSWVSLGPPLGRSWALLGALGASLGRSWRLLGCCRPLLRRPGGLLGLLWELLGGSGQPKANFHETM